MMSVPLLGLFFSQYECWFTSLRKLLDRAICAFPPSCSSSDVPEHKDQNGVESKGSGGRGMVESGAIFKASGWKIVAHDCS